MLLIDIQGRESDYGKGYLKNELLIMSFEAKLQMRIFPGIFYPGFKERNFKSFLAFFFKNITRAGHFKTPKFKISFIPYMIKCSIQQETQQQILPHHHFRHEHQILIISSIDSLDNNGDFFLLETQIYSSVNILSSQMFSKLM